MKLLSLSDVAKHTRQSSANVSYHVRCGHLPATKVGSTWVVREDHAREFAEEYDREWREVEQK